MTKVLKLIALTLSTTLILITISAQSGFTQSVPARIISVYETTDELTNIPFRVPSIIPLNSQAAPTEYWAASIAPSLDSYFITFDRAGNCTDVMECSFASVSGKLAANSTTNYQQLVSQSRNQLITLSNGIPAIFSPYWEGMYGPSSVYVEIDSYLYTFSIYMADQADVVAMANSALTIFRP